MMKRRLFQMLAAAFAVSLCIQGKALAWDGFSFFRSGNDSITAGGTNENGEPCGDDDGCNGHRYQGKDAATKIYVESGEHTIYFEDVLINKSTNTTSLDKEVFRIGKDAVVHLVLKGNNQLYSGKDTPGIIVPEGAKLDISTDPSDPKASLTVNSAEDGSAAGIGGGPAEGDASIGEITINSGTINALGRGDYPGIGTLNGTGHVIVNGGVISAEDNLSGSGTGGSKNKAIQCGTISSTPGEGHFSIIKGSVTGKSDALNALVSSGKDDVKNFTVYGDVILEDKNAGGIDWTSVNRILFNTGSCLTLPENSNLWDASCNRDNNNELVFKGSNINLVYTEGSGVLMADDIDKLKELGCLPKLALKDTDFMKQDSATGKLSLPEGTYTGFSLAETVLTPKSERNGQPVESIKGWVPTIRNSQGKETEFKDAGTYMITFRKSGREIQLNGVIIHPRKLSEVNITISPQTYTGNALTPEISAKYEGKSVPFEQGTAYTMTHNGQAVSSFTEADSYEIEFTGVGNFTETTKGTFVINKAVLKDTVKTSVTVDGEDILDDIEDKIVYDTKRKKVEIKVTHEGKTPKEELDLNTDYTITYSGDKFEATQDEAQADFTNAGKVTINIEGAGNYQGNIEHTFEIRKKKAELAAVTAKSRDYNGTDDVVIEKVDIEANSIFQGDDVSVDPASEPVLTAKIDSADVGNYNTLTFDEKELSAKLTGVQSGNYAFEGNEDGKVVFKLPKDNEVKISTASLDGKPEFVPLEENKYTADKNYETFEYTVKVSNPITEEQFGNKIEYEYKIDDGEWQDEASFKAIEPESVHTFHVRTKAVWPKDESTFSDPDNRANIKPGTENEMEITFKRLPQAPPNKPTLEFEQNEGSPTFTATINIGGKVPEIPGIEYSFDGKTFSDENTKSDCTSGTNYTGYVRFKETKTHLPGEIAASDTVPAPQLTVNKPVIEPGSKSFLAGKTIEVTMSCSTAEAVIYYTLDGKTPTVGNQNTIQWDGTPITITETTTVRAIATAPEMFPAESDPATYTKITTAQAEKQFFIKRIDVEDEETYEIPKTLLDAGLNDEEAITVALFHAIMDSPKSAIAPFNYLNTEYFDIKIQFSADGKTDWVDATPENFPAEGVTISLSDATLERNSEDLKDVDKDTHVFLAAHMFTDFHGDFTPGDIEVLDVAETEDSLQFTMNGTSPIVIAWAVGDNPDNNKPGGSSQGDDSNGGNGSGNGTENGTGNAGAGDGSKIASEAGLDETNGDKKDSEDGILAKAKEYLSSLPVTGDTSPIVLWIAIGGISLLVVILVIVKLRKR